jgi:hypothetical protein
VVAFHGAAGRGRGRRGQRHSRELQRRLAAAEAQRLAGAR